MTPFQERVETVVQEIQVGKGSVYREVFVYNNGDDSLIMHLRGLDKTRFVVSYCIELGEKLGYTVKIEHNSPTSGFLVLTNYHLAVASYDPYIFFNAFADVARRYFVDCILPPESYATEVYALEAYMRLSGTKLDASLMLLNEKEEIIDQITGLLTKQKISTTLEVHTNISKEEKQIRACFNLTFNLLDDNRSAGTVYCGDNGEYILRYLDITEEEMDMIMVSLYDILHEFAVLPTYEGGTLDVSVC